MELGEIQLRRWVSIALASSIRQNEAPELCAAALSRARFCELICAETGHGERSQEAFLAGLFSLLDTILGRSMAEIVAELRLSG